MMMDQAQATRSIPIVVLVVVFVMQMRTTQGIVSEIKVFQGDLATEIPFHHRHFSKNIKYIEDLDTGKTLIEAKGYSFEKCRLAERSYYLGRCGDSGLIEMSYDYIGFHRHYADPTEWRVRYDGPKAILMSVKRHNRGGKMGWFFRPKRTTLGYLGTALERPLPSSTFQHAFKSDAEIKQGTWFAYPYRVDEEHLATPVQFWCSRDPRNIYIQVYNSSYWFMLEPRNQVSMRYSMFPQTMFRWLGA